MVRVRKLAAVPDSDSDSDDDLLITKVDTSIYGDDEDDIAEKQQTPTRRRRGRPRKVQEQPTTIRSPQQKTIPKESPPTSDGPPVELSASGRPIRSVRKRSQSTITCLGEGGSPTPTTPRRPLKVTKLDVSLARKQISTPRTPSWRVGSDNFVATPVGLTPEKRLLFTPESCKKVPSRIQQDSQSCFDKTKQEPLDDTLPTPPTTPSLHNPAKTLFHRGYKSKKLIGRETERQALSTFFDERLGAKTCDSPQNSGCIYVSGPPGTGKSAVISEVIDSLDIKYPDIKAKVARVNCMAINRPQDIFIQVYEMFNDNRDDPFISVAESISLLTRQFKNKSKTTSPVAHVLMLDEIDRLVTRDQEILYQLFDWAFDKSSNLIIVGIANALDLANRFVYKIKSRLFTPQLLNFRPYSAEEIERIIIDRLSCIDQVAGHMAMHPAAIQLCSRKTSQSTGDLRKAFDICRRAFELVEEEDQRQRQCDQMTLSMVTIAHISRVCSTVFGKSIAQRVKTLNLQQKAVLCSLVVSERKSGTSLSVEELYTNYCRLCLRDDLLDRLNRDEFQDVITALDSVGAINLSCGPGSGGGRNKKFGTAPKKISAAVREIDLLNAVGDIGILRRFFND